MGGSTGRIVEVLGDLASEGVQGWDKGRHRKMPASEPDKGLWNGSKKCIYKHLQFRVYGSPATFSDLQNIYKNTYKHLQNGVIFVVTLASCPDWDAADEKNIFNTFKNS
jgi:hypothetical protein